MLDSKVASMGMEFLTSGCKISLDKFLELWKEGEAEILDVRLREKVKLLSVNFGINIPLHELPANLDKVPKDKLVATFCSAKLRAAIAFTYLLSKGFENVRILDATAADIGAKVKPGLVKK